MATETVQLDNFATRQRLLEAAGEIFAERGFHNTSVRDICQRAGANVAAVNYHFGDKSKLYGEVLRYAHVCAADDINELFPDSATPEESLGFFVRNFLQRTLHQGRPAWHGKLMAREMADPTDALDSLVQEHIRPRFERLLMIIAGVIGAPVDHPAVRWHSASVISQCLFFFHNRPVIQRLYPDLTYTEQEIDFLAAHITRFSLMGLRGAKETLHAYPPGALT